MAAFVTGLQKEKGWAGPIDNGAMHCQPTVVLERACSGPLCMGAIPAVVVEPAFQRLGKLIRRLTDSTPIADSKSSTL